MIIGIGGPSRSGKSTLARLLVNHYRDSGKTAIVLYMDDFVFPTEVIPKVRDKVDWECPESINFDLLSEVLDFYKSKFEVVVVDGFLAFYDKNLSNKYDERIFVSVSKETFLTRKEQDLRWGDIPRWFFEHIWESYLKYGIPDFEKDNYLQVSGETEYELDQILEVMVND
jgi:nicotinamide/nicotinate riboside kinase